MKVKELIAALQRMPQDVDVAFRVIQNESPANVKYDIVKENTTVLYSVKDDEVVIRTVILD